MADPNNLLTKEGVAFNFICKAGNTTFKRMIVQKHVHRDQWNKAYSHPDTFFTYCAKSDIPEDYYKVGFCRNPIDRLVSCWKDKVKRSLHRGFTRRGYPIDSNTSLEGFIDFVCDTPDKESEQHFRSQTWDLLPIEKLDALLRIETMKENWDAVRPVIFSKTGIDYGPLQTHNKSTQPSPIVSQKYKDKIYSRFEEDFKVLGYEY